jgi:hypothetical protein
MNVLKLVSWVSALALTTPVFAQSVDYYAAPRAARPAPVRDSVRAVDLNRDGWISPFERRVALRREEALRARAAREAARAHWMGREAREQTARAYRDRADADRAYWH